MDYTIIHVKFQLLVKFRFLRVKQRLCRCEVSCFAQGEVKCDTHARRHFTMRSIASHQAADKYTLKRDDDMLSLRLG